MTDPAARSSINTAITREDWRNVGFMVLALYATRLAWIAYNPDSGLYWEEDYRWVAAREILSGFRQPVFDYQADNYQGGSLVQIALITGAFAIFGETLASLKIATLVFPAATLVALFVVTRIWFGRTTAWLVGVGYLIGPPLIAFSALIPMGSHGESALFSLIQLGIFLGILTRYWHTPAGWAALGCVTGLGLWYCYTSGLSLAACGLAWLILEGVPNVRLLLAGAGGTVVGLAPWFVYNLQNDFAGFQRLLEIFGAGDPIDAWAPQSPFEKVFALLTRDLPTGLVDPFLDPNLENYSFVLQVMLYTPVVIALGAGFTAVVKMLARGPRLQPAPDDTEARRARLELVFYLYGFIFLAAYLASSFTVEPLKGAHAYRLFLPLVILMFIPVSISMARLLESARVGKRAGFTAVAVIYVSCATGTAFAVVRNPPDRHLGTDMMEHVYRGYLVRGVLLHRKFELDLNEAFNQARRIPGLDERFRSFQGIGWGIQYRFEGNGQLQPFLGQVDQLVLGERVAVLSGLRWTTGNRVNALRELVAEGRANARDLRQKRRLEKLKAHLDRRWERVPLQHKTIDRIIY